MIEVQQGDGSGTFVERVFSEMVALSQQTVIRSMVISRARKQPDRGPSPQLRERLRALGLVPERMWWGPMTLHPSRVEVLIDEVERRPPKRVLEIGCGTSSAIFAALADKYDFEVMSLENHQSSIDYVESVLEGLPIASRLKVRKCGFVRRRYPNGERYWWFDAALGRDGETFDFVFIDGPMGRLVGRNGALPEVIPHLEPEVRIYLDDFRRKHERHCVAEWQRHYPGTKVERLRGLARIQIGANALAGTS